MIVIDTETTGLIEGTAAPLNQQPRIIEFAAVKLHDTSLKRKGKPLTFLVDPGVPVPPEVTEITGLTTEDVKGKGSWARHHNKVVDYFLGERVLVAHNLPFDVGMLHLELSRLDLVTQFPWPPDQKCTVETTQYFTGKYLSLDELYRVLFDEEPQGTRHRALEDVEFLVECVRVLRTRKMI